MLSSRDTPFDADGWALIIEDIKRLALLVGGGANDLNAGAIDATQEAINDLSTALNSHEVDPEAHAALLAGYARTTDIPTSFAASYISAELSASFTGTATDTVLTGWSTASNFCTDSSGGAWGGTSYTAPATGAYQISLSGYFNSSFSVATHSPIGMNFGLKVNASAPYSPSLTRMTFGAGSPATLIYFPVSITGIYALTSGDAVSAVYSMPNTAETYTMQLRFSIQRIA